MLSKYFCKLILIQFLIVFSFNSSYSITTKYKPIHDADSINQNIICLDSHLDTPLQMFREGFNIHKRNDPYETGSKVDFIRLKEGGVNAAFFAVYLSQGPRNKESYKAARGRALKHFNMIFKAIEQSENSTFLATHSTDAKRALKNNKIALYIGLENAFPLGKDLEMVEKYYDLGARYITLTHNLNNDVCDSSTDPDGPEHNGLSEFGKKVIKEMNHLGMMIDVSHISDQSFFDIIKITEAPIIASHSNVRELRDVPRNLTDEMLFALKENGGVVQVNFVSYFLKDIDQSPERLAAIDSLRSTYVNFNELSEEEKNKVRTKWHSLNKQFPPKLATVKDLVDHIDYIVNLIGIDHVGIGSDFDGGGALKDCFDVSQMSNITAELLSRGYSLNDIKKIWAGNFIRVFKEVEQFAGK